MAVAPKTLSGKSGEVHITSTASPNLLHLASWTLEYGANIEEYHARSGGGATETQAGVEGGSGSFELMMSSEETITSLISTGDLVDLELHHDASGTLKASGEARIGRMSFGANRDGTMQRVTVPFTCHKAWTLPNV